MKLKSGGFYWKRELYQSQAFNRLGKNSLKLLIALYDVRQRESRSKAKDKKSRPREPRFTNLDCLEVPYRTLQKKYRMNDKGITRAIDELLKYGFIKITHPGGLGEGDKNKYGLIDDYQRWKPGTTFRRRMRDVKRGYQGRQPGGRKKRADILSDLHAVQNVGLENKTRRQNVGQRKLPFEFFNAEKQ